MQFHKCEVLYVGKIRIREQDFDVAPSALTAGGIIYGVVVGLSAWDDNLKLEKIRMQNDLLGAFWDTRIDAHIDAAAAAATLANLESSDDLWEAARVRFWELYNGELVVVEDAAVCIAMVRFSRKMKEFDEGKIKRGVLKEEARSLANTIRQSLRTASEARKPIPDNHTCS